MSGIETIASGALVMISGIIVFLLKNFIKNAASQISDDTKKQLEIMSKFSDQQIAQILKNQDSFSQKVGNLETSIQTEIKSITSSINELKIQYLPRQVFDKSAEHIEDLHKRIHTRIDDNVADIGFLKGKLK